MTVSGITGGFRPQNVVNNIPIVGAIAQGTQAGKSAGEIAGDVFKSILDPLGLFSGGSGPPPTAMTGQADKIAGELSAGMGARQAYNSFDHNGYNAAIEREVNARMPAITAQIVSGQLNDQQIKDITKQIGADATAAANAQFGTPPANPDAFPKPAGGYDWVGYNKALNEGVEARMAPLIAQFNANQISAAQLEQMSKQVGPDAEAAAKGQFGNPPEIVSPNSGQANYPHAARDAATGDRMKAVVDDLMPQIMSGQLSGPALEQILQDRTKAVVAELDAQFGPYPGPTPYDPAKDTKEIYDQNRWQMEAQIQSMQESGSNAAQIQGYKLQRQAEMAQMFPQQTQINDTRDEWKAVAQMMLANGKSEGEVKDWLKKKEEAYKDPSPEELAVYSAKKQQQAAEIMSLIQANQSKAKTKPKPFEF